MTNRCARGVKSSISEMDQGTGRSRDAENTREEAHVAKVVTGQCRELARPLQTAMLPANCLPLQVHRHLKNQPSTVHKTPGSNATSWLMEHRPGPGHCLSVLPMLDSKATSPECHALSVSLPQYCCGPQSTVPPHTHKWGN
jgi:hypothetical protein